MIAKMLATVLFDGGHPRDPGVARLLGISPQALSGAKVDQRSVMGLSPIYRGVNILGNAVAKCTPHIYRRLPGGNGGDKELATDHPAWFSVVRWANQWMSAAELRDTVTAYAVLRGNGICHVDRTDGGTAFEYIPLLPDRTGMAVFGNKLREDDPIPDGAEILYWTMVGGKLRTILPENILHIRGRSNNGVWGLDILEVMRETLGLAIAARDCGAQFYGQGMMQSGVLYMPAGMAKDENIVNKFVDGVKKQAQGLGRSHKLLVIEEGAKYEKMSVDPETAQALETREFAIRELANIVGCQPHKLGDTKRTSYASLEQANQEHLDDDVDPWLRRWEEALMRVALRDSELDADSHFIECNRKALLRTNLQARSSHYASGRQWGYYSVNDIRRFEGLDPIGPEGDTYLVPANMVPADQAGAAFEAPPDPPAGNDQVDDAGDEELVKFARFGRMWGNLAMFEVRRLVTRISNEAVRKAGAGGGQFIEFLAAIPEWCQDPAEIRTVLLAVGEFLRESLDKFTQPPYAASELKNNVANAMPRLAAEALIVGAAAIESSNPFRRQAA